MLWTRSGCRVLADTLIWLAFIYLVLRLDKLEDRIKAKKTCAEIIKESYEEDPR